MLLSLSLIAVVFSILQHNQCPVFKAKYLMANTNATKNAAIKCIGKSMSFDKTAQKVQPSL